LIIDGVNNISVIIPSNHGYHELLKVLQSVCRQTAKPAEIVIVDSALGGGICPPKIVELCAASSIQLIYSYNEDALPGHARNIGLELANGELIAFIDVQTIPRPHWLESYSSHASLGAVGVWGSTCFSADTKFERLLRDGFYGVLPRRTLPGSIFRREVFSKAGHFIGWVRAGEDTEWMLRLKVLKIPIANSPITVIDYVGLNGANIRQLLKKWHRNYMASRDLPHLFPQKLMLWLVLYPLLVLVAFNWNYLIAGWRMDSPFYIGHATKIVVFLPCIIYLIARGLVIPLKRGVDIWRLLPVRFVAIALVCFMADIVKVLVLSLPKLIHYTTTSSFKTL
jgi:glycosyltransferase involved in cell wall biosynthesis